MELTGKWIWLSVNNVRNCKVNKKNRFIPVLFCAMIGKSFFVQNTRQFIVSEINNCGWSLLYSAIFLSYEFW